MPRANRLSGGGGIFHLTHRCHNRSFLLKFARDRNAYRSKLREKLAQIDLSLLDYSFTCNHVHLLVDSAEMETVSQFMRAVAGEFARTYNHRKSRINSVWGDSFHATLVEGGEYLWNCLVYIELNMVRSGVVAHPSQWEWCGYHEIMGSRKRYRLLDLERLCWRLRAGSIEEVRQNLVASVAKAIAGDRVMREPCWTEGLAVGSAGFVEQIRPLIVSRREKEIIQVGVDQWCLREQPLPYG